MSAERMAWRPLRWLISRRAAKALLWAAVIVAAAVGANIAGIYLVGSVAGWKQWLQDKTGNLLVSEVVLYGRVPTAAQVREILEPLVTR